AGSEHPSGHSPVDQVPGVAAERGRALFYQFDLGEYLVSGDTMALPGAAAHCEVLEHRLQSVKRPGELRFLCPALGELGPQLSHRRALLGRQDREYPVGGGALGDLLALVSAAIGVEEKIAGVDLDDVVHEHN